MRRSLPAVALGSLLALVAILALMVLQPSAQPSAAERTDALARELRCPDCQGLSVADSPTQSAREIRRQIGELVDAGATDAAVRGHFVDRYGEWILLAPSSPLPWVVPFAVVVAGAVVLVVWLLSRRQPEPSTSRTLSADERRRLREEAEALDA